MSLKMFRDVQRLQSIMSFDVTEKQTYKMGPVTVFWFHFETKQGPKGDSPEPWEPKVFALEPRAPMISVPVALD